jgi:hypothetical protein
LFWHLPLRQLPDYQNVRHLPAKTLTPPHGLTIDPMNQAPPWMYSNARSGDAPGGNNHSADTEPASTGRTRTFRCGFSSPVARSIRIRRLCGSIVSSPNTLRRLIQNSKM